MHIVQVIRQHRVEGRPVPAPHGLESTIVGLEHVGFGCRWCDSYCRHGTLLYTPAAMDFERVSARQSGITCRPNISMECNARSCGMVSVWVIKMT